MDDESLKAHAYMNVNNGLLTILCPRGHVQVAVPYIFTEDQVGYGSSADFCDGCEGDPGYEGSAFLEYQLVAIQV